MKKPSLLVLLLCAMVSSAPCSNAQGNAAKGKQVFEKQTCAVCHPGGGNTIEKTKTLTSAAFKKKTDAQVAAVIRNGIKGSAMPAFGKDKISDAQLKDLLAYIRCLK
jgi:mono/diheme cytochrome c family protein